MSALVREFSVSEADHSLANDWGSSATWDVAAAEQLVLAVHGAGPECAPHFLRPREDEMAHRLSEWLDLMGQLAEFVSDAFTHRDVLPDLTDSGRANRRAKDLATIFGQVFRLKSRLEKLSLDEGGDPDLLERIDQKGRADYPDALAFLSNLLSAVEGLQKDIGDRPLLGDVHTTAQSVLIQSLAEAYSQFFGTNPSDGLIREFSNYHGPFPAFLRKAYELSGDPKSASTLTVALQRHFPG
jgi:hypothetical protein